MPLYGLLHHVGRRSGRPYATPVVVRTHDGSVYVPLPFGERTDWYRNAVAAGEVRLTWNGAERRLTGAQIIARTEAGPAFRSWMHAAMRMVGIERVVRFTLDVEPPGAG